MEMHANASKQGPFRLEILAGHHGSLGDVVGEELGAGATAARAGQLQPRVFGPGRASKRLETPRHASVDGPKEVVSRYESRISELSCQLSRKCDEAGVALAFGVLWPGGEP